MSEHSDEKRIKNKKKQKKPKHDLEAYATTVNTAITITLLQLKSNYYFNTTGFNV